MLGQNLLFALGFLILPLVIFISAFFLIYNGFVLLKREGKSKANLLSLMTGLGILVFFGLFFYRISHPSQNIFLSDLAFVFVFYTYFLYGFAFAGFMLYSYLYLFIPKKKTYDFIIIHGAGLLGGEVVTPLLKKRIDKAVEAFQQMKDQNPNLKIIASGGQGPDEKVSEARAITHYLLTETDVPESSILLEDQSRTTYENLLFSKKMGEDLVKASKFLFVTNDYHVFRTSVYARTIGMTGDGLGCATASYYIPSAFIREFIAICVRLKWLFVGLYLIFLFFVAWSYKGILW